MLEGLKKLFKPEDEVIEGSSTAYAQVQAMDDKELKRRFMGVSPMEVPREAQEELYKRFVKPYASFSCTKCYGRGYTGWHHDLHQLVPCQCLQARIRKDIGEENQSYLYDANGNKLNLN